MIRYIVEALLKYSINIKPQANECKRHAAILNSVSYLMTQEKLKT